MSTNLSNQRNHRISRRTWLEKSIAAGLTGLTASTLAADRIRLAKPDKAKIAITLDLEMSRNFPRWEDRSWDYEKGNLNAETKRYSTEAARRVKTAGGVLHFFAVGRVFEQESVAWLKKIARAGHPIGNHTYDHVNVTATRVADVQFRFQRSPWLVEGKTPTEIIRENIRLCSVAMQSRLGIQPNGFRTPGGFSNGLRNHAEVRAMLLEQGFRWVSSLYPSHANSKPMEKPSASVIENIVATQAKSQPFVYPDGLIEIPMSPISDIGAFRNGRWKLAWFLTAVRRAVEWSIEHRAVFDFLAHPSCLYVVDPKFQAIDLICQLVHDAGDQAEIVGLDNIAKMMGN